MNKKQLITISLSALFAASAMGAEIPAIPSDIVWDGTTNVKIESGTHDDIVGGTNITVLGKEDGSGPTINDNKKFRGSKLAMNGDDSHVYIYGGTYGDKVSGIHYLGTLKYAGTRNNTTGHMYIYGGSFDSDITGFGMAQNTTGDAVYTANTDIHILGAISNGTGMGVYGGVAGGSGTSASLVGNTSVTVSGNGNTSFIVGGNRMTNTSITGTINLTVKDKGSVGGVLGGNYVSDFVYASGKTNTNRVNGDINILVSGGAVGTSGLVKGIVGGGANTIISGSTNITIEGDSSVKGGISGGSIGWDVVSVSSSNISINGGTIDVSGTQTVTITSTETYKFLWTEGTADLPYVLSIDNAIVGGNIAGAVRTNAEYTMTTSAINITGGSITGTIYGGGIAKGNKIETQKISIGNYNAVEVKSANGTYTATSHVGTANITVDASQNTVSIDGNIYGGGRADDYGTATVGDVNIVFKGDGSNLTFTGTVDGNGHVNGSKSASASVSGTQTFTFDSYNGTFSGTIQNFDTLNVVNSKLTGTVKVGNDITAEKIHISGDSSVGKFVNASGDTLTFGAEIEEGGNLEIDSGAIGSENSSVSSVTLTTNASVTVKASEASSVTLTSSAEGVVVNKAEEIATGDVEINVEGIVVEEVLAAWSFDISNNDEDVTVTMDVGEDVDVSTIKIFHRENETSAWEDYTEVVKDIKLENGKLTFTTTSFSDYTAAIAAPEPSAFGLLAGLGAIALAVSRRRRIRR